MPLPRLRNAVRVFPYQHKGKEIFLAIDSQEGLFDQQVMLPPVAFVVAAMLDGKRDAEAVREEIERQIKDAKIGAEDVESVVEELDRHYLLESPRAQARRREIADEYLALPARPARFAKGTEKAVRGEIDRYYEAPAGAGSPGAGGGDGLAGIVAPHIDFPRGGNCYTFAYRQVAERSDADVYVVLGVAHVSPPSPFVMTSKDFETPLGTVPADRGIVEGVAKRVGNRIFEYETFHRAEHSVEFQAVFLKHARPSARFSIVPILCSSFEPLCKDASPSTVPEIADVIAALREETAGRKVCIVAGADLAHVGPVFGDDVAVDQKLADWMMAEDNRSLRHCVEGNAEGFWNSVMADGNRRHVCGLSAIYAALRLMDGTKGKLLRYGFAPDPAGGFVSFASLAFGAGA